MVFMKQLFGSYSKRPILYHILILINVLWGIICVISIRYDQDICKTLEIAQNNKAYYYQLREYTGYSKIYIDYNYYDLPYYVDKEIFLNSRKRVSIHCTSDYDLIYVNDWNKFK